MKPSHYLAALAWVSAFALIWARLLRLIEGGTLASVSLLFFLLIALGASAIASNKRS